MQTLSGTGCAGCQCFGAASRITSYGRRWATSCKRMSPSLTMRDLLLRVSGCYGSLCGNPCFSLLEALMNCTLGLNAAACKNNWFVFPLLMRLSIMEQTLGSFLDIPDSLLAEHAWSVSKWGEKGHQWAHKRPAVSDLDPIPGCNGTQAPGRQQLLLHKPPVPLPIGQPQRHQRTCLPGVYRSVAHAVLRPPKQSMHTKDRQEGE